MSSETREHTGLSARETSSNELISIAVNCISLQLPDIYEAGWVPRPEASSGPHPSAFRLEIIHM